MAKPSRASEIELQLNKLRNAPPALPKKIHRAIADFGADAADPLLALLQDPKAELHVRGHAAQLLAELGDGRGIAPLLEAIEKLPKDEEYGVFELLAEQAARFGSALIAPAFEWLQRAQNKTAKNSILKVLLKLGAQDERLFQALVDCLDPEDASTYRRLVAYADQRGIDLIFRRFDEIAHGPFLDYRGRGELKGIGSFLQSIGISLGAEREGLLFGFDESILQFRANPWEYIEPEWGHPREVPIKPQPPEEVRARVNKLLTEELDIPSDATDAAIRECGPDALGPLIELMEDDALYAKDRWPSLLAADVLGDMRDARAIKPMLKVAERRAADGNEYLLRLEGFGPMAAEPILDELEGPVTGKHRKDLIDLLAKTGVRNERIYQFLLKQFREDPEAGVVDLARYGDRRALPVLLSALDSLDPSQTEKLEADSALADDLRDAVHLLGGKLTPEQNRKVEAYLDAVEEAVEKPQEEESDEDDRWKVIPEPAPVAKPEAKPSKKIPEPGRNELCWCGSGKKYKKCHLGQPLPDVQ